MSPAFATQIQENAAEVCDVDACLQTLSKYNQQTLTAAFNALASDAEKCTLAAACRQIDFAYCAKFFAAKNAAVATRNAEITPFPASLVCDTKQLSAEAHKKLWDAGLAAIGAQKVQSSFFGLCV